MSNILCEAGVAAASIKLLQQHIGSEAAVNEALMAIKCLAVGESAVGVLVSCGACNVISQCMASHPDNPNVQAYGAISITRLSNNNSDARFKFGQAGACEAIIKALSKHANIPETVEHVCAALNELSCNVENNAKFGNYGAPAALCLALTANQSNPRVLRVGFKTLQITATIAENRVTLGDNNIATCVAAGLRSCGTDDWEVVVEGCGAITSLVVGSAINRSRLSQVGCCEIVLAHFQRAMQAIASDQNNNANERIVSAIRALCIAMYSLGSGNSDNQRRMFNIKPLLAGAINNKRLPDSTRLAAREADTCIQVR